MEKLTVEQVEDLRDGIRGQPWTKKELARGNALCDMALASLRAGDGVWVPREPTGTIVAAIQDVKLILTTDNKSGDPLLLTDAECKQIYKAMLSASEQRKQDKPTCSATSARECAVSSEGGTK